MKNYKILIDLIILVVFFNGCSNKTEERDSYIPVEYQFPYDKIGDGVTKYFEKLSFNNGIDSKLKFVNENMKRYLIRSNYNHVTSELIDSTKYSLTGKKIEIYTNFLIENLDFANLKGKIKSDKIIDDGSHYGTRESSYEFEKKARRVSVYEVEKYLYDTIFYYKGNQLKCMVTSTVRDFKWYKKNNEIAKETVKEISYYGKGIGLCKMRIETKDNNYVLLQRD